MCQRSLLGSLQRGRRVPIGDAGVIHGLGIIVDVDDPAGVRVDLVVIFLPDVAISCYELDLIDEAAVVPVGLGLEELYAGRRQASMLQGDLPGAVRCDGRGRRALLGRGRRVSRIIVGHGRATGQGDRLGVLVPVHGLAHQLTDGAHRQIDRALIFHRLDLAALGVIEGTGHAVNDNSVLRANSQADVLGPCIAVCRAGRCASHAGTANADGLRGRIPVDILTHQFTDGAHRQVGGILVADRMDLSAACVVKRALGAIDHNIDIRAKVGFRRPSCRRGAAQHCSREHHCKNLLFHKISSSFYLGRTCF